jgi:hypothetical protein
MANARPVVPPPAIDRAKLAELRWLVEEFHYEYAARSSAGPNSLPRTASID